MHTPGEAHTCAPKGEGGCTSLVFFLLLFIPPFFGEGAGGKGRSFKWIVAVSSAQESFISRQKGRQGCDSCLREETNGLPEPDV